MLFAVCFLIIHWYLSLFCQSFYLHRYVSHGMFTLSRFWNRAFCLLTILAQGPSFLRPQHYKKLHFRHHLHSDKEGDPHSPIQTKNIIHMMKKTYDEYMDIGDVKEDFPKMINFADSIPVRILFVLIYCLLYLSFTDSYFYLLLVPIHAFMGPIHGAIVNWCGHRYGYRNHEIDDHSKNTLIVDFLMMGELYQNNHHKDPHHPNFAFLRFEVDFTFLFMKMLTKLKIIRYQNVR